MSSRKKPSKTVIIGDSSVGKTCIIQRFINNTFGESQSTIGACHYNKQIKGISLDIWDTAGQERFKSMIPMYYKGAKVIIIVFDVTDMASFDGMKKWFTDIENNTKTAKLIIVGNKTDLKDRRVIEFDTANSFSNSKNSIYIETSAKDNINIDKLFDLVADEIAKINAGEEDKEKDKNIDINTNHGNADQSSYCGGYC